MNIRLIQSSIHPSILSFIHIHSIIQKHKNGRLLGQRNQTSAGFGDRIDQKKKHSGKDGEMWYKYYKDVRLYSIICQGTYYHNMTASHIYLPVKISSQPVEASLVLVSLKKKPIIYNNKKRRI